MIALGDSMKRFEAAAEPPCLDLTLPVIARIDGKAFHTYTRGMQKPFDRQLTDLMVLTTWILMKETRALFGYTQSDEISLVFDGATDPARPNVMFNGRVQKLASVIASFATAHFNKLASDAWPAKPVAFFDCRVWNVPSRDSVVDYLRWREADAHKNAIAGAAQTCFTPAQLLGLHSQQLKNKLRAERGIDFDATYAPDFRWGTYVKECVARIKFSADELDALPPKHAARSSPNLSFNRKTFRTFSQLPSERQEILDIVFTNKTLEPV